MTPRPNMDHIRKPQILDAAGEVITERGLAGARIADIADRAGTSPPAVLYWFEDREQLLNEALGWSEDRFYDSLTERLDSVDTPAQRLRLLFEASAEDPDWTLWMELWARALRDEQARKTRLRLDARWRDEIAALVTAGQATGEFDGARDADEIALLLASLLDGLALQATLDDPSVDAKRVRDLLIEAAGRLLGTELPEIDERTINRGHEALAEGG
jgi:AcrR family transcriptional regulator